MKKKKLLMFFLFCILGVFSLNAQQNDTLTFDENIGKGGYNLDTVQIGTYHWALNQTLQQSSPGSGDRFFGTNSVRMRINNPDTGYVAMTEDKPYGLGSISFYAGRSKFSGDTAGVSPTLAAEFSTDQGTTWSTIGTADLNGVDTLMKFGPFTANVTGNVRIRVRIISGDNKKRINLDSLIFSGYESPTACADPTGLIASDQGDGSMFIQWTAASPAPANGYTVVVVPNGQAPDPAQGINVQYPFLYASATTDDNTNFATGDYDVYVYSNCGNGNYSAPINQTVSMTVNSQEDPCEPPATVSASVNPTGSVTVVWDTVSPEPAGYLLAVVPTGTTPTAADGVFILDGTVGSYELPTLPNGNAFQDQSDYDIYILTDCGYAESEDTTISTFTYVTPSCVQAANLQANVDANGSVFFTWNPVNPAPSNGFNLLIVPQGQTPQASDAIAIANGDTTNISIDTLSNGNPFDNDVVYVAYLVSNCGAEFSDTATVNFVIPAPCATPTGLMATENTDGTVTIIWNAVSSQPEGYQLAIVPQGTTPQTQDVITISDGTQNIYVATQLGNGNQFSDGLAYTVYIVTDCGSGLTSSPTSTNFTYIAPNCVQVSNINVDEEDDGSMTFSWPPVVPTPLNGYSLIVVPQGQTVSSAYAFSIPNGAPTEFSTDTLANGDSFAADANYVAYIVSDCGTTFSDTTSASFSYQSPCAMPTNMVVTDNHDGTITVSWTGTTPPPADGYAVSIRKNGDDVDMSNIFFLDNNVTTLSTDSLLDGTPLLFDSTYSVSVIALCNLNADYVSASVDTNITLHFICFAPSNLTATADDNAGTISISWDATTSTPNDGYYWAIVPTGTTPATSDFHNTTSTSATQTNVTAGSYDVYVYTLCSAPQNEPSDTLHTTVSSHVGLNSVTSDITSIYPNPTSNELNIELSVNQGNIAIVDLTGKTIFTKKINSKSMTLDLAHYPAGIYQLVITTQNGVSVEKLIKK